MQPLSFVPAAFFYFYSEFFPVRVVCLFVSHKSKYYELNRNVPYTVAAGELSFLSFAVSHDFFLLRFLVSTTIIIIIRIGSYHAGGTAQQQRRSDEVGDGGQGLVAFRFNGETYAEKSYLIFYYYNRFFKNIFLTGRPWFHVVRLCFARIPAGILSRDFRCDSRQIVLPIRIVRNRDASFRVYYRRSFCDARIRNCWGPEDILMRE